MQKSFANAGEMITDETFLGWYFKEDNEKVRTWEDWMISNPGYANMVARAVSLMNALPATETQVENSRVDSAYKRLIEKLDDNDRQLAPVVTMRKPAKRWWMAAAAVLLLVAAFAIYRYSAPNTVLETAYGQVAEQCLPDGSEVMLNANTVVKLGKGWKEGDDREVWLKGEAFFHVKKNSTKNRFIVHTDQLDVIVTGTQFNVRTANGKTSVLLTEGSVTIRTPDGRELPLVPGEFVEIGNNTTEKIAPNQETILAWKESKLNFDRTPMKDVATMITNHYGVEVKLADEIVAEKTITGMMPNNNLNDLLEALEATTEFKITRTNNTITIAKP